MQARLFAAVAVAIASAGCCGGSSGDDARVTQRLETLGVSIETVGQNGGQVASGYAFTSSDGSSTTQFEAAVPGLPAAQRSPLERLPGATAEVQWQRPVVCGGIPGVEARVIERAPLARVHWVAAFDGPRGPFWMHVVTDQRWITGPTVGDLYPQALCTSMRRL